MAFSHSYYDSTGGLHCLLVEHFGLPDQILPIQREASRLCGSKHTIVDESMRRINLPQRRRALDLGCAVGGSVFALRRHFPSVIGVDRSATLLAQARALQEKSPASVTWMEERQVPQTCCIQPPTSAPTDGIEFLEADVLDLPRDIGEFDFVMTEKLPECLPDPEAFVAQLPRLVAPGGCFLHISSYRWSEVFTAPEKQLGTPTQTAKRLDALLSPAFVRRDSINATFLLDCDTTWFCFGVAEGLLWQRV